MPLRRLRWLLLFASAIPSLSFAGGQKPCVTADEASKMLNKDVCITAHVYDVVQLPDGTRFLDVCSPQTSDDDCRFTIVNPWEDHDEGGGLRKYRNLDVQVRGIAQPMPARAGLILSHARQFRGGPPRFKPN